MIHGETTPATIIKELSSFSNKKLRDAFTITLSLPATPDLFSLGAESAPAFIPLATIAGLARDDQDLFNQLRRLTHTSPDQQNTIYNFTPRVYRIAALPSLIYLKPDFAGNTLPTIPATTQSPLIGFTYSLEGRNLLDFIRPGETWGEYHFATAITHLTEHRQTFNLAVQLLFDPNPFSRLPRLDAIARDTHKSFIAWAPRMVNSALHSQL